MVQYFGLVWTNGSLNCKLPIALICIVRCWTPQKMFDLISIWSGLLPSANLLVALDINYTCVMLCKQNWQARINQGCVSYLSAIFPSERMPLWTNILLFSYRKLNNPLPLVRLSATQMKLTDLCKCLYTIRLGARFSFLNFPLKKCFFFAGLCQNSFAVPLRWVDLFFFFFTSFTSGYGSIFGKCPTLDEWTIRKLTKA